MPLSEQDDLSPQQIYSELLVCAVDPTYFVWNYCQIYEARGNSWIPFRLWPDQRTVLDVLQKHRLAVILKARQLGMSWLVIAKALHKMLFAPAATILIFSRRADEAEYLLGEERMRGMWRRLPEWMRLGLSNPSQELAAKKGREHIDAVSTFAIPNGSIARAFPTNAGDSYTASLAIVDEADLCPDLNKLMRSVKPTIDGGGSMILLSRADKSNLGKKNTGVATSEFKRIYLSAKQGQIPWHPIFLPWHSRKDRDQAWYEEQKKDILARTGALDDLYEQYPATDTEALAARSLDKRIPGQWLDQCFVELAPQLLPRDAPAIPGLQLYVTPYRGGRYCVCADPAEGNPTSDDSALEVIDLVSGQEVCCLAGKLQPSTLADYVDKIGQWYNMAPVLVERNNHGHAVMLWLQEHSPLLLLAGLDGRPGWVTTAYSKAQMWSFTADALRGKLVQLYSFATRMQLGAIEGSTLRAPEGEFDDRAVAFGLCCVALMLARLGARDTETEGEVYGV